MAVDCKVLSCLFGVQWVMPCRVLDLLACWKGRFAKFCHAVPLCLMWTAWRECNRRAFEGIEGPTMDLKLFLVRALFDWMTGLEELFI